MLVVSFYVLTGFYYRAFVNEVKKRKENMDTFINGEDDFVLGMERCLFIVNLAKWKITLYVNGQCYNQSKLFNFF